MSANTHPLPFPPYEKIAESLAAYLGDDEAAFRALSRTEWLVSEKIHGANFCFVSDGEHLRCAKRKAFLEPGEDFFDYTRVRERLAPSILRIAARLHQDMPNLSALFIYGELFGGSYPHPDVAPIAGLQPIQTGCWYSPDIEFCAFDVGYILSDDPGRLYLDQDKAQRICEDEGIGYTEPLFRGSYEEAYAYPLGFETTLPSKLSLPSLGPDNQAEGIVLKPAKAVSIPRERRLVRPVVKRKIHSFSEDERFHNAEKWAAQQPVQSAPLLEWLKHEASALVNENRLNAAISKVGRPGSDARKRQIQALIEEDLHTELKLHHSAELQGLSALDKKSLLAFIEEEAKALVGLYLGE